MPQYVNSSKPSSWGRTVIAPAASAGSDNRASRGGTSAAGRSGK